MTEQAPLTDPEPLSRHEQRLADPSRAGSWIVGLILIILGGMFLMNSMGTINISLTNWWAVFILLPAFGSLSAAWRTYQEEGRLNGPARAALLVGLVLTFIAFTFLFGISWTYVGPILLTGVGIAILFNYVSGDRS